MKLKFKFNLAPDTTGKYKKLRRNVTFIDGSTVDKGKKVRILGVGPFVTRIQIPSLSFKTAQVALNAINWN